MPRLLSFLPCERVVISKDDNSASLFTVLQGFKMAGVLPTEDEPASLPIRWSVFTLWRRLPEDDGRHYEQGIELIAPSGKVLLSQVADFVMVKTNHRHTSQVFGFPVVGAGTYALRLSLRNASEGDELAVVTEYPLDVRLEDQPELTKADASAPEAESST